MVPTRWLPITLFDFTFKTIEARSSLLLEISVNTQARWFPPFFHHRNRRGGGAGGKNFPLVTTKIVGLRYQLTFSLPNQWGAHIYLMFSFSFFELVLCCFDFLSQPYFFLRHRRKLCFQVLKNISQSSGNRKSWHSTAKAKCITVNCIVTIAFEDQLISCWK